MDLHIASAKNLKNVVDKVSSKEAVEACIKCGKAINELSITLKNYGRQE